MLTKKKKKKSGRHVWCLDDVVRMPATRLAFLFFHSFFNSNASSGKNSRARLRRKKRVEQNQTALPVGDIYSGLRAYLALTSAINFSFFSLDFSAKG